MSKSDPSDTAFNRGRTALFKHLPGKKGEKYRRKDFAFRRMDCRAAFEQALSEISGGLCVDLGANRGYYTRQLAERADRVVAFEPDPWTAEALRGAIGDLDNVEVIEAAAGTTDGTLTMYRAPEYQGDPEKGSESTSSFAEKSNVDPTHSVKVRQIDFAQWLAGQQEQVALLKIDIEGGEVDLLETLFDHPVLARIERIFCETHETRLPSLRARTDALRKRAGQMDRPFVNLDWT